MAVKADRSPEFLNKLKIDLQETSKKFQKELDSPEQNVTIRFFRNRSKYKDQFYKFYNSFTDFKKDVFGMTKKKKDKVFNRDSINKKKDDRNRSAKRRYFVTSAIAGQSLNEDFFKSVLTFCKNKSASLVILPMRGVLKKEEEYPEELKDHADLFVTDYIFNSNLRAFDVMLLPQQINPLTGLPRLGQKQSSLIIASPKQQMKVVPVSYTGLPHILHSTGCITNPDTYAYNRAGVLARQDHVIGGLVVEIEDKAGYHIREVQSDSNGGFYDLDEYFNKDEVNKIEAEAFVMGDYHSGFHDETAVSAWKEVIDLTKPKYVLFHDLFDGFSISHHHEHNIVEQSNRPEFINTLEKELKFLGQELDKWIKSYPKIEFVAVRSNHDEHLDRYLQEGRYNHDRFNHRLALELAIFLLDGFNPIEEYLSMSCGINTVKWLKRDEDFKVAGIQLGYHGDKGSDGGRGNINSLELSFGKSVVGHMHTPQIIRDTWVVGTTSLLQREFTKGHPSSWLHTSCIIYKSGQRSLITSLNGKWKI